MSQPQPNSARRESKLNQQFNLKETPQSIKNLPSTQQQSAD